jgi:hypothetical protein
MGELFRIVGGIAGIAGISMLVFMYIFRDLIKRRAFSGLTQRQSFQLWLALMALTTLVTVVGISAWLLSVLLAPKAVSVVEVGASVDGRTGNNVLTWHTPCPVSLDVTGNITAEGTGYVKYQFINRVGLYSEDLKTEPQEIYFGGARKTNEVVNRVRVPFQDQQNYYYSVKLKILEPGNLESEPVGFTVACDPGSPQIPTGMPPPPDLPPEIPPPDPNK